VNGHSGPLKLCSRLKLLHLADGTGLSKAGLDA
jgi:hypothetical protein